MASGKLKAQDRRDLEKFTKFLILKAAQIIVQSRTGEKVVTLCKPHSPGAEWFNLSIHEMPQVLGDAKKIITEDILSSAAPLCIEISLRTTEGDILVLETWSLGVFSEYIDPSVRITYTIYNRMGTLLKSLLCVSRTIPAYQLSGGQSPDSYLIHYKLYVEEPHLSGLGDSYKHLKIGQVYTPVGMIQLSVNYRMKMTISPVKTGDGCMMLKSDHFYSDFNPEHTRQYKNEAVDSASGAIKIGAFVVNKEAIRIQREALPNIPYSSLLETSSSSITLGMLGNSPPRNPGGSIKTVLLNKSDTFNDHDGCSKSKNESSCVAENQSEGNCCISGDTTEDYILIDLKTPFAARNSNNDLGTFYRDCRSAPQLQTSTKERMLEELVGDLAEQLEAFETNMLQYEDLLNFLHETDQSH